MSKRILVPLDPSNFCKKALELALLRAKIYDSTIIGVGVVDLPGIEKASSGAATGASHYAKEMRQRNQKQAVEAVDEMIANFESTCKTAGVSYESENHSGSPVDHIIDASMGADIIITGTRTHFHFQTQDDPGNTLQKLLSKKICPLIAVPESIEFPWTNITFPYDSSPGAAKSMRMFALYTEKLPIDKQVTLLRVDDQPEQGLKDLDRPARFLEAYGYDVDRKVLPGDPKDVVLEYAKKQMPGIVCLGADGRSALAKLFFGSVTNALLSDGTIPLFIAA